jgi:Na+/melibiose symporter-like transporter
MKSGGTSVLGTVPVFVNRAATDNVKRHASWALAVAVIGRSFITMYEVPSSSLAAELTEDYDERSSILGHRLNF